MQIVVFRTRQEERVGIMVDQWIDNDVIEV